MDGDPMTYQPAWHTKFEGRNIQRMPETGARRYLYKLQPPGLAPWFFAFFDDGATDGVENCVRHMLDAYDQAARDGKWQP